jgi:two-component system alkaline phosphatase synthesis response regulator PhoP
MHRDGIIIHVISTWSNRFLAFLGILKHKMQTLQVLRAIIAIKGQMCYNNGDTIGYTDAGWKYMIKILVVEDERPINDLIEMNLSEAGYSCRCAYDGIEAADILESGEQFDLILLDIMLPGANGYELMEYIKPMEIPVIFLTAKGSVADRVKGLKLGADDYLVKPFEIVELLARVESILRRAGKTQQIITIDDVVIDTRSRSVKRGSREIPLTMKEYELLLLFARNRNIALFRETLYERVWENEYTGDSRTVDLHVQRLRKKMRWEDKIRAIYKVGYRLEA